MARIVVIGAGPMGLAAAYQAVRDGHQVDLIEAAPEPGGMAAHFDFSGISLERFYHFVCKTDYPTFALLRELGLEGRMRWVPTSMGYFYQGKLNRWGDPLALLQVKDTPLLTKLRYGWFAFVCTRRKSWPELETTPAHVWLRRWCGERGFEQFWRPLLDYKFYEYATDISAQWIWTRIKRIGSSRRSLFQEELGYIEGGSQTLVDALVAAIKAGGGRIHLRTPARKITAEDGRVTGVEVPDGHFPADRVLSTMPVQYMPEIAPDLPEDWRERYAAIRNVGICCVLFKLRRAVSPHFWVNITDPRHEIPGVIEFSNLRPVGGPSIVYVPYYMPQSNPKFSWTDRQLIEDSFACLRLINPALREDDILDARVARLRYAQPICEPGFAAKIPPVQTPIAGLQIADTCFYYPEDRGIAESVRLGRAMARAV